MRPLLRILALWRGRALWLLFGLLVSLAAVGAGVSLMVLAGLSLAGWLGGLIALRVLGPGRVVLRYFERLTTHAATFRALTDLRVWFFRGLARSAAGGLGFRRAGDVLTRLVADVDTLDGLYLRIIVPLAGALLLLPALVVLIASRFVALGLGLGALFAGGAFLLPWLAGAGAAAQGEAVTAASSRVRIAALDALTGLREVRSFGAEGRMLARVQACEAGLFAAQRGMAARTALAGAGSFLCAQLAIIAVLFAAGADPLFGIAGLLLTVACFEAAATLPRAGALTAHTSAAARRVIEAAEQPAPVPDPPRPVPLSAGFTLRFEAVHFRWGRDRPQLFDALTLYIPEASRVALLGRSGSGKSTLAALALKLASPDSGRVTLGGTDLSELPASGVRARIGWLAQATHLFDDTIRNNLLLARPDADEAALWAALDAARIGEMVRALPEGLESWVGESGTRFSGGQGRRLALARALLSPASILILDEPCAGLDAETERAFLLTLNEVAAGRTIILISHRLTGVERLDRIWRLSGGRAVAAAG